MGGVGKEVGQADDGEGHGYACLGLTSPKMCRGRRLAVLPFTACVQVTRRDRLRGAATISEGVEVDVTLLLRRRIGPC